MKVSDTHLDGKRLIYSFLISIHFFSGLENGLKMVFLDLNHSLGRVESSDLVQMGGTTPLMSWEGCNGPRSNKSRSYREIVFLGDAPE